MSVAPSSVTFGDSFPPRGSLWAVQTYTKKALQIRVRRWAPKQPHHRNNAPHHAKTSEWERAGHKKRGGGGHPPATLCVRAFSRESLDPPPGTGREPTSQGLTCAGPNRTTCRRQPRPSASEGTLHQNQPGGPAHLPPEGEGFGGGKEAFHLGYRAALHTLKAAVGHDAVTGMLHDILLTEYDLGVLRTSMEQERMDAAAPPEE